MSDSCEVVISGISGRLPECENLDEFRCKLYESESPITYDERKWPKDYRYKFGDIKVPHGTGKFKTIDRYDNIVFAVSPFLANHLDIINRMVLEPSFEAVLDAGINPYSLEGANVGCFLTSGISEVENIKFRDNIERMSLIGGSKAMLSNRVSFALNLTGPSVTFYCPAFGGLDALTYAYENLITHRIDGAIVGGSNSHVDPKLSIHYQLLNFLSPDGISRVFDDNADGFGRSDCVVILYLQRATDAKRSYGTLLFSETIYRGLSLSSFIGFDETFLEETLRTMYSKHKDVDPNDISYLEMDASGVKFIDEREVRAASKIFCNKAARALLIGSVKSHSGHTETASGYLSILKTCLALDSGLIAPNMHYIKPNINIEPLVNGKMKVVAETTELPGPVAGVTSITISGAVSHAVLKQHFKTKKKDDVEDNLPRLLLLCGRMGDDLMSVINKIESAPLDKEFIAMTNDIFKTPIPSHMYRGYAVVPSPPGGNNCVEVIGGENRPVWFLFSGMGSQWNGMGKDLLNIPVFADVIEKCDAVLRPKGIDIYNILSSDDPATFEDIISSFVGIVAVQLGLVKLLNTIGIKPDGMIGHSLGETGCAYADGAFTLEQALLASYERGVVSNELSTIKGMMAAVGLGYHQIKDRLPEEIEVACHNSVDNCTLSGPAEKVAEFVTKLQQDGIFARSVNVADRAYHSKYVRSAAPTLLKKLQQIVPEPKERSSKWISTSVPEANWNEPLAKTCSAEYFTNNFLNPVLFEEGCKHIPDHAIIIEIAPHGLLQAILRRALLPTVTNVSLTQRSEKSSGLQYLLSSIGKLFIAGCQLDVNALYPKIEYPVSRGTPNTGMLATWDHSRIWEAPSKLYDKPLSFEPIEIKLNRGCEYAFVGDHQIGEHHVIPVSFYMYITWYIFSVIRKEEVGATNIVFEDIRVRKHIYVSVDKPRYIMLLIQGSGRFEVRLEGEKDCEKPKIIMTGIIYVPYEKMNIELNEDQTKERKYKMTSEEFYKVLQNNGYHLKGCFENLIQEVEFNNKECSGKISWNGNWVSFLDAILKVNMYSSRATSGQLLFPKHIRILSIQTSVFKSLNPGDEITFKKDLVIDGFRCNGLEMIDFKYEPQNLHFLSCESKDVSVHGKQFVSHSNPNIQSINTFLNFCLQLAYDNIASGSKSKLRVIDTVNNVQKILHSIVGKRPSMKSNVIFSEVRDLTAGMYPKDDFYFIVINSYCSLNKLHAQLKNKLDNLFVLVINSLTDKDSIKNKNAFIEITKQTFNDVNVQLFKKLRVSSTHLPPVMIADEHWPMKLAPVLKSKTSQNVVLLRYSAELTDLSFMLSKRKQYPNVRCLFIMDDQPPKFSIDDPFYRNQIMQDLPIAVLRNGAWGSYRNLNPVVGKSTKLDVVFAQPKEFKLPNIDLKVLNVDIEVIHNNSGSRVKESSYGLEFSGISKPNVCIMGLGLYNPYKTISEPDEHLVWSVPQYWSLEDAATVPLIYSQVYYLIFLNRFRNQPYHHVLVNSENLSFAEAVVNVTSHYNITAYIVVANCNEAEILLKRCPTLKKSQLLDRTDCKFEVQFKMATKAESVVLMINCLKNIQNIDASSNCLNNHSHFADMTDRKYENDEEFGMYVFLKSVTYFTGPQNIQSLLKLPIDIKKKLHNMIQKDIRTGAIRPLSRIVSEGNPTQFRERDEEIVVKRIHKCFDPQNSLQGKLKRKIVYDEKRSFIIISTKKTNFWFELAEWLTNQGVRKLFVVLENATLDSKISQQINRLTAQKNATIILTSSKKTETVEDASELISEANNMAPLEAVFFVSLDPAGPVIANFDAASRNGPHSHFVSLFSGGLRECERRRQNELSATLVYSQKPLQTLGPILPTLEFILNQIETHSSPLLYELVDDTMYKKKASTKIDLINFISFDLQTLVDIGYSITEEPKFIEIQTSSPYISETKNVRPVFLIPAVKASFLKPLTSKLKYPCFYATFTEKFRSAYELAEILYKDLKRIQPSGPITIIGETWSSPIAIELALLVQASQRKVQLFLIEGHPGTWKQCIESLGSVRSLQFDNNYLQAVLKHNKDEKGSSKMANLFWEENRDNRLKTLKFLQVEKEYISKAINGIRNRLIMTATYSPPKTLLKYSFLFKHKPSKNSLEQYSWSDDIYLFEEDLYETFLSNEKMIQIIHENALYSWF